MKKLSTTYHRPFILPTFSGVLFFFFIINIFALGYYRNSAPFHAVGLTLIILGLVAMIQSNNNLAEITGDIVHLDPGAEGSETRINLQLRNPTSYSRYNLAISLERQFVALYSSSTAASLTPFVDELRGQATVSFTVACPKRGIYPLQRFKVSSKGYYGLFYVWKWFTTAAELVVYPRPEGSLPLPIPLTGHQGQKRSDQDFVGHRPFLPGASLKQVDWKAYARGQELLLKDFQDGEEGAIHFSYASVPGAAVETRLRQLSAWVFACHKSQRGFSLDIGNRNLPLNHGTDHLHQTLTMLADFKGQA